MDDLLDGYHLGDEEEDVEFGDDIVQDNEYLMDDEILYQSTFAKQYDMGESSEGETNASVQFHKGKQCL